MVVPRGVARLSFSLAFGCHALLVNEMAQAPDHAGHHVDGLADLVERHQDRFVVRALVAPLLLFILLVVAHRMLHSCSGALGTGTRNILGYPVDQPTR
jgi:hypothetical protein